MEEESKTREVEKLKSNGVKGMKRVKKEKGLKRKRR